LPQVLGRNDALVVQIRFSDIECNMIIMIKDTCFAKNMENTLKMLRKGM
jgi:hypothetical protein